MPKGNPLGPAILTDVARTGARFANRPWGSGTRVLLEDLLAQEGLTGQHIAGLNAMKPRTPQWHRPWSAVRLTRVLGIENGRPRAWAGLCPLVDERYHLACLKATLEQPATRALRGCCSRGSGKTTWRALPGIHPCTAGRCWR